MKFSIKKQKKDLKHILIYTINETNRVENCDKDDEEMEGDK